MPTPTLRGLLYQTRYFPAHPLLCPFGSSEASGELWMGIKGKAASIPPNTARNHYDASHVSSDSDQLAEALRGPVWVGGSKNFLAYGTDARGDPQVVAGEELPWFLSPFSSAVEFMDTADPEQISSDLALKVHSDLLRALEIVELLDGRGGVLEGVIDQTYDGSDLTSRSGADAVREELREARRIFDERVAAINYGLLHTQMGSRAWIDKRYGAYLREWRTLGRMRGALLDLQNFPHPEQVHVLDMLSKGVPLYYPLGEPYSAVLTEDEQAGLRRVSSTKVFCRWLALKCHHPPLDLSQPDLWPTYRPPLIEQLPDPNEVPPKSRLELMDELSQRLRTTLADLIQPTSVASSVTLEAPSVLIIGEARLIVDPITELRMMLWAITHRSASLVDVFVEAFIRGWPFHLVYSPHYLESVRVVRDRFLRDRPSNVVQRLPDLEDDFNIQTEWRKQLAVAVGLVDQPHGRAFLYEGGVLRRLALLYGAEHHREWQLDWLVPSVSVTSRRLGREEVDGYRGDQVSSLEAELLLGTVRHQESGLTLSWFPSSELLERYGYYNGEWSNLAESFIRTRYDSLQRGESIYGPLMESQWEEELARYPVNKLLRESLVFPDHDEIDELLQEARTELRASWNASSLDSIEIGIGRGDDAWWRN